MRRAILLAAAVLVLTGCNGNDKPRDVQLTFQLKDSTVVMRELPLTKEAADWTQIILAMTALCGVIVSGVLGVFSFRFAKSRRVSDFQAALYEQKIKLAMQVLSLTSEYWLLQEHQKEDTIIPGKAISFSKHRIAVLLELQKQFDSIVTLFGDEVILAFASFITGHDEAASLVDSTVSNKAVSRLNASRVLTEALRHELGIEALSNDTKKIISTINLPA
jgi:hypothetical protein